MNRIVRRYQIAAFFFSVVGYVGIAQAATETAVSVMKFSNANKPIALLGLDEVWKEGAASGCYNHAGFFEVDDIAYEGVSDNVGGIRVKKIYKGEASRSVVLITINTKLLSNAEKSWIPTLVSKGSKLFIAYAVCGNGGYHQARDIYRADSLEW